MPLHSAVSRKLLEPRCAISNPVRKIGAVCRLANSASPGVCLAHLAGDCPDRFPRFSRLPGAAPRPAIFPQQKTPTARCLIAVSWIRAETACHLTLNSLRLMSPSTVNSLRLPPASELDCDVSCFCLSKAINILTHPRLMFITGAGKEANAVLNHRLLISDSSLCHQHNIITDNYRHIVLSPRDFLPDFGVSHPLFLLSTTVATRLTKISFFSLTFRRQNRRQEYLLLRCGTEHTQILGQSSGSALRSRNSGVPSCPSFSLCSV
ncbi:hypothetical protein B0T21DRAFT_100413 [Apiosordaria backusii]|uniref:Uncharacterized protein n=1 Tax=Apiosordaria backusii TaxID=314023 RepID=A0AA40ETI3_9PEZI|nr:hypothetical protein B0T21DRAFT_100413 [Apiosordaria backusii]